MIGADKSILQWVSPNGVVVPLSGHGVVGDPGIWVGSGPEGLGHVDVKALFDAAAMDEGENYLGGVVDHGEIDLPIHILGTSNADFQRRKEHFKSLVPRDRLGWLCAFTTGTGWRMVAARRGSFKPAYGSDPASANGATFDTMLIADKPHARSKDDEDEWANTTGAGTGVLYLYPGPQSPGWPKFVFTGPGRLRLVYAGNDVTMPVTIGVGREIFIDTDTRVQTIRERAARSSDRGRSLWAQMKAQYFPKAIPAGEVTRVRFQITGAGPTTKLWATVPQRHEGLL
ncbi:hypothetical protein SAMN05444374_11624 [Rhodococcoides kroppenstedtii]|uniref:Uncharacterized protein n=1 Tax=Rhodococcoides kroppenstedtii TaxID=293050 RepID=A0A1I0UA51_9NOCA|nr:hypothetical protein [Rhodococcus kroppenstedtii]SFA60790.1 hypothetical protein SAMN05444374_11624 [Rhodococcus kroppenstedtii]